MPASGLSGEGAFPFDQIRLADPYAKGHRFREPTIQKSDVTEPDDENKNLDTYPNPYNRRTTQTRYVANDLLIASFNNLARMISKTPFTRKF